MAFIFPTEGFVIRMDFSWRDGDAAHLCAKLHTERDTKDTSNKNAQH